MKQQHRVRVALEEYTKARLTLVKCALGSLPLQIVRCFHGLMFVDLRCLLQICAPLFHCRQPLQIADKAHQQRNVVPQIPSPRSSLDQAEKYCQSNAFQFGKLCLLTGRSAQALLEMELVGHDFYLFHDIDEDMPSVVYRRHGYQYGVIRLVEKSAERGPLAGARADVQVRRRPASSEASR